MKRNRSMEGSIVHFTHPGHLLTAVYGSEEFHCNGCEIPGFGPRYRCHDCDFNMHKFCGVCPSTLSTFMHPQHSLKQMAPDHSRRNCDLCGDDVEGLFYRCSVCDFNIHPICTALREDISHPLHPTCPLKLHTHTTSSSSSGRCCRLCKTELRTSTSSSSWVYGCRICGFDIHLGCILAPTTSRSEEALPPTPRPYDFAPPTTSRSVEAPPPKSWLYGFAPPTTSRSVEVPPPTPRPYGFAPLKTSRSVEAPPPTPRPYGFAPPTTSRSVKAPPPTPRPYGAPPTPFGAYHGPSYSSISYPSMPTMHNLPPFSPFSAYAAYRPPPVMPPSSGFYSHGYATDFGPSFVGPPPPSSGSYFHGHGGFGPHTTNNINQGQGGGQPSKWKLSRIISALVGSLSMGVLSNVIAAGITG